MEREPRKILDAARDGIIDLFTTQELINELEGVLSRSRSSKHLSAAKVTVGELVEGYAALAEVVEPASIDAVVIRDPDDDTVVACAVASESEVIVSGDEDLLSLRTYGQIRMITAAELVSELNLY